MHGQLHSPARLLHKGPFWLIEERLLGAPSLLHWRSVHSLRMVKQPSPRDNNDDDDHGRVGILFMHAFRVVLQSYLSFRRVLACLAVLAHINFLLFVDFVKVGSFLVPVTCLRRLGHFRLTRSLPLGFDSFAKPGSHPNVVELIGPETEPFYCFERCWV